MPKEVYRKITKTTFILKMTLSKLSITAILQQTTKGNEMKKLLILFMSIFLTMIYAETSTHNLDITNQCSGLKLLEVKL